ncbi:MAG: TonB-dependent receptor plug domain-containing protein [Proteobacteria bacterium]|nr:TonB-dependent receptor plug domain-containing protein [Pseudomonadota bacterium]
MPSNVQVLERDRLKEMQPLSLNQLLNQQLGGVTVSDAQNNPLQPEISYRFRHFPLLGLPQGLAVYANGTQVNEAFGDTVNFDLIPEFAIERVQLVPGSKPMRPECAGRRLQST